MSPARNSFYRDLMIAVSINEEPHYHERNPPQLQRFVYRTVASKHFLNRPDARAVFLEQVAHNAEMVWQTYMESR